MSGLKIVKITSYHFQFFIRIGREDRLIGDGLRNWRNHFGFQYFSLGKVNDETARSDVYSLNAENEEISLDEAIERAKKITYKKLYRLADTILDTLALPAEEVE